MMILLSLRIYYRLSARAKKLPRTSERREPERTLFGKKMFSPDNQSEACCDSLLRWIGGRGEG